MNTFFQSTIFNFRGSFQSSIRAALSLALLLGMALPVSAHAAGYLKLGDIKGEATDKGHKDWINLQSVTQAPKPDSIATATAGGEDATASSRKPVARAAGNPTDMTTMRRNYEPIIFHKRVDKSSPLLARAYKEATVFPTAVVVLPDPTAEGTYLRYELENVMITSYSTSGSGQSADLPTESVSLNYEKIKVSHETAKASIQNIRGL